MEKSDRSNGLDLSDWLVMAGVILTTAGVAAYDWRLALVVCGVILLTLGLIGTMRR